MAAAKKLEAVPTDTDRLHDAIRRQSAAHAKLAEIAHSREGLAEVEQREAVARSAVDALAAKDAVTLAEWARLGAVGDAPKVDEIARKAAAETLARTQREADAARAVQRELEVAYTNAAHAVEDSATAVAEAAAEILAQETWAKYGHYRALVIECLGLEQEMAFARTRLLQLRLENASKHGEAIGDRFACDLIPLDEVMKYKRAAQEAEAARWQALLRGEV